MGIDEAANKLREMYDTALEKEKAVQIHLFGIKYAEYLANLSIAKVVALAGLPPSYVTEVNKGKNLAKYVELKR